MTPRESSGNLPSQQYQDEFSPSDLSTVTLDEESSCGAEQDTNRSSNETEASGSESASFAKPQDKRHEPHRPQKRQKKIDYDSQALDIEKRKIDLIEQRFSRQTNKYQDDEDYAFFMSLLPSVKQLNQIEKLRLRMKIMGDVTDALEAHNFVNEVRSSGVIPSPFGSNLSSLQSSPYPSPTGTDNAQQSHPSSTLPEVQLSQQGAYSLLNI